jgi:hypothetical protein
MIFHYIRRAEFIMNARIHGVIRATYQRRKLGNTIQDDAQLNYRKRPSKKPIIDALISRLFPPFFVLPDLACKCTKESPLKVRSRPSPKPAAGVSIESVVVVVTEVAGVSLLWV